MTTPNPHRERDEAAERDKKAYKCMETYYELKEDGRPMLDPVFSGYCNGHDEGYRAGWDAALANDPCVRALVEALEMRERKGCNDTCSNALNETLVCDCGFYAGKNALNLYKKRTTPERTGE